MRPPALLHRTFNCAALALLALGLGSSPTGRAAPEVPELVPQQADRAAKPLVIEGHRFAFNLNNQIKASGKPTFRWSIEKMPDGARVVTQPDPDLLTRKETNRNIVAFEVDRAGDYTVAVAVTDKTGTTERRVSVTVKNTLRLLTAALPPAVVNQPYELRVHAHGGTPPYQFTLVGNLPAGLSFKDRTLSGRPTAVTTTPAALTLTVSDAAGATAAAPLALLVSDRILPWGMLNIGSSFTPHDDPLRAAAKQLGWDAHGWKLDRGGTLGVGIGYTWNNDFPQRWRMLDVLRSGRFESLFLHQGRPWGNRFGLAEDGHELTDLGALKAFHDVARDTSPLLSWPVYFNAYWRPEADVSQINASSRDYYTNSDASDDTVLYYEGSLRQAYEASRLIGRPVYLIPAGPVMMHARQLVASGKTPSVPSIWDLFAGDGVKNFDGGHFSHVGNTLFAQTYFAQTYRVDVRTLPFVYKHGSNSFVLANDKDRKPIKTGTVSPAEGRLFQEIIHRVVTNDPFSGFTEPASLDAYLASMRTRLGWWETFDSDITPISGGTFTGDNGRRWTGLSLRRWAGIGGPYSIEIAAGGELSTSVDNPFDLLYLETSHHHRDEWSLEILAGGKVIATLPAPVDGVPASAQVAQWFLKNLRAKLPPAPFTLTIRNNGKRGLGVDNIKLRTAAEHGWMLQLPSAAH